jgi:hypothetical protein
MNTYVVLVPYVILSTLIFVLCNQIDNLTALCNWFNGVVNNININVLFFKWINKLLTHPTSLNTNTNVDIDEILNKEPKVICPVVWLSSMVIKKKIIFNMKLNWFEHLYEKYLMYIKHDYNKLYYHLKYKSSIWQTKQSKQSHTNNT